MEITKLDLVSQLKWKSLNDECPICNNQIGCNCIKCDQTIKSKECFSIMNNNINCKHSFHIHCLAEYHKNNKIKCPMCSVEWK